MKTSSLIILLFISCISCNDPAEEKADTPNGPDTTMAFDRSKWRIREDGDYVYREQMLKDLIDNVKLKGLQKQELANLLGEPDRKDSNYLFYRINETRMGLITLHTTTLVIKFLNDTVEWRKIHK